MVVGERGETDGTCMTTTLSKIVQRREVWDLGTQGGADTKGPPKSPAADYRAIFLVAPSTMQV